MQVDNQLVRERDVVIVMRLEDLEGVSASDGIIACHCACTSSPAITLADPAFYCLRNDKHRGPGARAAALKLQHYAFYSKSGLGPWSATVMQVEWHALIRLSRSCGSLDHMVFECMMWHRAAAPAV